MSDTPTPVPSTSRRAAFVALIVGVSLVVLIVLIAGVVILTRALLPGAATAPENVGAEIVVAPTTADGSALDGGLLADAAAVVSGRLDRAGIPNLGVLTQGSDLHVWFAVGTDAAELSTAQDAISDPVSLEVRPVIAIDACEGEHVGVGEQLVACDGERSSAYTLGAVALEGTAIADSTASEANGGWVVTVTFDAAGSDAFADLTGSAVGSPSPNDQIAIVVDGVVLSAPAVQAVITDGVVQISGGFDRADAEELASTLALTSRGVTFQIRSATLTD